jgi:hypothetical protein
MRARLEVLLLVLALGAVGAFVVSFALGWRPGAVSARVGPDSTKTQPLAVQLPPASHAVRVEVLNVSGKPGIARVATDKLRERGFDVVYFGNGTAGVRARSAVLDRAGKLEVARAVASALGIAVVESAPDTSRLVEASVLLGSDWLPHNNTNH